MPDYLASVEPDEPMEIPGTGGKTVTFKGCAAYADQLACDLAGFGGDASGQRLEAYFLARTVRMIVSWTLEDREGNPLPVTAEALQGLTAKVGSFLEEQARMRFEGRDEEAERPFVKPSSQLSVAG